MPNKTFVFPVPAELANGTAILLDYKIKVNFNSNWDGEYLACEQSLWYKQAQIGGGNLLHKVKDKIKTSLWRRLSAIVEEWDLNLKKHFTREQWLAMQDFEKLPHSLSHNERVEKVTRYLQEKGLLISHGTAYNQQTRESWVLPIEVKAEIQALLAAPL
jgi:hypothetical protein